MELLAKQPNLHIELLVLDQKLVCSKLSMPESETGFFYSWVKEKPNSGLEADILAFLKCYAEKKHLPCSFLKPEGSPFFTSVIKEIQKVHFGCVKTYQEIAKCIESPLAARAVGNACNANPYPLFIPCHRITAARGKLGGFATGIDIKQELLRFEKS